MKTDRGSVHKSVREELAEALRNLVDVTNEILADIDDTDTEEFAAFKSVVEAGEKALRRLLN